MRTKTLLLSAAALAAGLVSSFASSSNVYSVNIVGYVNKATAGGVSAIGNPLIANGGNNPTNVFPNADGHLDFNVLLVWNGLSFDQYYFDSTKSSGFTDGGGTATLFPPNLNPGTGFLYNNIIGDPQSTFVGQVTGVVTNDPHLLATVTLPGSPLLQLITSPIPLGGGVISSLQFGGTAVPGDGSLDFDAVLVPTISGGSIIGYVTSYFDSTKANGFTDGSGTATLPEPVIPVAGAFFFANYNGSPYTWNQDINLGP